MYLFGYPWLILVNPFSCVSIRSLAMVLSLLYIFMLLICYLRLFSYVQLLLKFLLDSSQWFWLHGKVTGFGDMAKSLVLAMFMQHCWLMLEIQGSALFSFARFKDSSGSNLLLHFVLSFIND